MNRSTTAITQEEKADILINVFALVPPPADLADIDDYEYRQSPIDCTPITENELNRLYDEHHRTRPQRRTQSPIESSKRQLTIHSL